MISSVLIVYSEFGLGPYGKARSLLQSRPEEMHANMLSSSEHQRQMFSGAQCSYDLAVIVGDPSSCKVMQERGIPCVYIDSLPFLWTKDDLVALDADIYCAQQTDFLPIGCWPVLGNIRNLKWVPAIVPTIDLLPERKRPRSCVVHFGGVSSPIRGWSSYIDLMFPTICTAVESSDYCALSVFCSSQAVDYILRRYPSLIESLRASGREVRIQFTTVENLLSASMEAEAVLTSPGLTFMLECAEFGIPIVLLPPQNLSQLHNRSSFIRSAEHASAIEWPSSIQEEIQMIELSPVDEVKKVTAIYKVIQDAISDKYVELFLVERIREVLRRPEKFAEVFQFSAPDRVPGTTQVWRHVNSLLHAQRC